MVVAATGFFDRQGRGEFLNSKKVGGGAGGGE